jgi:hypothetical protein
MRIARFDKVVSGRGHQAGGFDAPANPRAVPDRCHLARPNAGGVGTIADQLSLVRQSLQNGYFGDILLFYQP